MQCIPNSTKKAMLIPQAPKTKHTKWKAFESIKNKNGGNAFARSEEKEASFLAGPAAALSLQSLWLRAAGRSGGSKEGARGGGWWDDLKEAFVQSCILNSKSSRQHCWSVDRPRCALLTPVPLGDRGLGVGVRTPSFICPP